jgi:hypothetical protein
MRPLIYELFVLSELMVQPMSGSFLHETARRILGPFRPLSWGIISPLLRRLEQQGLVTSVIEQRRAGLPPPGRGQPRVHVIFLHSSTILSVADLAHPNLPAHNKLIFAKK